MYLIQSTSGDCVEESNHVISLSRIRGWGKRRVTRSSYLDVLIPKCRRLCICSVCQIHEVISAATRIFDLYTSHLRRVMRNMQAPPNSQRSTQKRAAVEPSNPPQPTGTSSTVPQTQQGARTSSSSSRSSTYRRQNVCSSIATLWAKTAPSGG